jgi:hypothetical protein
VAKEIIPAELTCFEPRELALFKNNIPKQVLLQLARMVFFVYRGDK